MTTLNGLVAIDFNLSAIVVATLLSSQRAVLIHYFDDDQRAYPTRKVHGDGSSEHSIPGREESRIGKQEEAAQTE